MVILFSFLLLIGIAAGQLLDLAFLHQALSFLTAACLAYIMMEVRLDFSVEKRSIRSYGWDFAIASMAAILPALLWLVYFIAQTQSPVKAALLAGLSSAPTSAGVLFAMLGAAGLGATWVFKKARVLAVLDDLVALMLLTPLEIIIHGFEWRALAAIAFIVLFLWASFKWQNALKLPLAKEWFVLYALILTSVIFLIRSTTNIHLEVLIPAFMWGCLVKGHGQETPVEAQGTVLDTLIKCVFMFLVGLSFPKIVLGQISWTTTMLHVLALTILANLGKMALVFCYAKEASFKERLALGVAMFPRGEVGAAVLLIGIGYGLAGYENTLAVLSLAFNLILTGVFIWIVISLLTKETKNLSTNP